MKLEDFNYNLPEELIAQYPIEPRDHCRLLVFDRAKKKTEHKYFFDILEYLQSGDVLVLNNSRVFPARIFGEKKDTGGKVEILLQNEINPGEWEAIGKNLKVGAEIIFENSKLEAKIIDKKEQISIVKFNNSGKKFFNELEKIGKTPLPPYIKHEPDENDIENYQTVYADNIGSVAAPTAGLHFTEELLKKIKSKRVTIVYVTLNVGLGTFVPVKESEIENHKIHSENFSVQKKEIEKIIQAKKENRRIIAVGTTSARVLEHIFSQNQNPEIGDYEGSTNIFIYPGYKFKCVDGLITNFHLPKSTLLMLISAFSGRENIMKIYDEAIKKKYRFFSYGDAMFLN